MARREHVGIGTSKERRHLQAADVLGEVEVERHRRADLVEQPTEVLRARRDALVQLVHRRVHHELRRVRAHLALLSEHLGVDRAPPDVRRDHHEPPDDLRVLHRRVERDAAAERVAHDVGLLEPEVADQGGDVVGHEPNVDRPIDVGCPPVSL